MFIFCYAIVWTDKPTAMWMGIVSLAIRQTGHAVLEPPCHDAEELLLGFNTRAKCFVFSSYILSAVFFLYKLLVLSNGHLADMTLSELWAPIADAWFWITAFFVFGHVAILILQYGFVLSMVWLVKFVTDPFTDMVSYRHSILEVWTTKDWQSASLRNIMGHMNKEPKAKEVEGLDGDAAAAPTNGLVASQ